MAVKTIKEDAQWILVIISTQNILAINMYKVSIFKGFKEICNIDHAVTIMWPCSVH